MKSLNSEPDLNLLARQLWAIGDPVRLQILRMLPTELTREKTCNVSTIAEKIGLSQPCASHHLRILRQAGMIANKKKCRDMIYWIRIDEVGAVTKALRKVLRENG